MRQPAFPTTAGLFVLLILTGDAITAQAAHQYRHLPQVGGFSITRSGSGNDAVCGGLQGFEMEALLESARLAARVDSSSSTTRYTSAGGDIITDLTGFTRQAELAFQFAVEILGAQLNLDIPIHVEAMFEPLAEGVLGAAGPAGVFVPTDPSSGLPALPPALLDQVVGRDFSGPGVPDITASFNSSEPFWYFGLDADPGPIDFDFVSIVLHELFHGLGFIDSFSITEDESQGMFGVGDDSVPVIFDTFLENGSGETLIDLANPSADLLTALTGGDLFFAGPVVIATNGGTPARLFAPSSYDGGSSTGHWDDATFPPGSANALMTPFQGEGEANHDPGPLTIGLLRDLGYLNAMLLRTLSIPQFGDGAGITSDIVVVNLSVSNRVQGTVHLFDPDGNELDAASVVAGGTAFDLAPRGSRTFSSNGTSPDVTTGSAVVESNGAVSAVIRFELTGTGVAGVGSAPSLSKAIAPVRRQGALSTGVAFRNTSPTPIAVNLTLKDENGESVANGETSVDLAINGRSASFIHELFPQALTTNFRGTLCLETEMGTFAGVAIELELLRAFTTLPMSAPEN